MSIVIVNVSRGRRRSEDKLIVKRAKLQVLARVFTRSDGGAQKAAAKTDPSHNVTPTTMAEKEQQDQQGKKRKGKIPEAGGPRPKKASNSMR
ncbi:hypothetical protein R1flu_007713 [Riccia fluitans]|uniref:Uncharacterized protein n=1 Tax=Riccia fluitans TaxID=41844 RepID=A0ABD1Z2B3_9MARC